MLCLPLPLLLGPQLLSLLLQPLLALLLRREWPQTGGQLQTGAEPPMGWQLGECA